MPTGISAGHLLIVCFGMNNTATVTWPGGWTRILTKAGSVQIEAAYRVADGSEGASITITTNTAPSAGHTSYRITGYTGTPVASAGATGTGFGPDPDNLTTGWGAVDALWIAALAHAGTITGYPSSYSNALASVFYCDSAERLLNAASENPGGFTQATSAAWAAGTLAVKGIVGTVYTKTLTAGLTFSGSVAKVTKKPLAGSITPGGSIAKKTLKALAGSITPAGSIAKTTQKALAGSVSFIGSITTSYVFGLVFTAAVTFAGSITKQTQKALAASLTPAGSLVQYRIALGLGRARDFATWVATATSRAFGATVLGRGPRADASDRSANASATDRKV